MEEFKDYLGAVEYRLDDVLFEIGLRQLKSGSFQGTWTCWKCNLCGAPLVATQSEGAAMELAKQEAEKHHEQHHENSEGEALGETKRHHNTVGNPRKAKSLQTSRPPCRA